MKELELLQSKIELLLQKCTQLKEENTRLQAALQDRESAWQELQTREQQLVSELDVANTERQDTQQLRAQVDTAIGELDKILGLIDGQ